MDSTKSRAITERQWKKWQLVIQSLRIQCHHLGGVKRDNALISAVREINRGTCALEETFNELLPFHRMGWGISSRSQHISRPFWLKTTYR